MVFIMEQVKDFILLNLDMEDSFQTVILDA